MIFWADDMIVFGYVLLNRPSYHALWLNEIHYSSNPKYLLAHSNSELYVACESLENASVSSGAK